MSTETKQIPVLKVTKRSEIGTRDVNCVRAEGGIPAQVYGHKKDNELITLNGHELELCLRDNPTLVTLDIEGVKQPALIKELQRGTFGSQIMHLDFQRVSMDEPVDVAVPVDFYGTAQGAEQGSRLEIMRNTLRIRVRADSIPTVVRVNVGEIPVGTRFTFGMVSLPSGAVILGKPHTVICQISQSKRAAAAAPAAAPAKDAKKGAAPAKAAAPAAGKAAAAPAAAKPAGKK